MNLEEQLLNKVICLMRSRGLKILEGKCYICLEDILIMSTLFEESVISMAKNKL